MQNPECLDYKANNVMITMLREPIARYLSEWKPVTRGARKGNMLFDANICTHNYRN